MERKSELKNFDKDVLIHELIVHQRQLEMQTEELKRLNYELENLKNQYFELFNSAPIGYIVINQNGIIKNCNLAFQKMIDKSHEQIIGTPFSSFLNNEDRSYFILNLKKFIEKPESSSIHVRIKGKNREYYTLITGKPTFDKSHILMSITDITEIVEKERILKTYMSIIEVAPVSIIITDRENKTVYVNENYAKVTGYSKEELIGKNPGIVKSGLTPKETYIELWNNLKNKKSWTGRFINKKKNGELFTEEAYISPIFNEIGKLIYYIAIKRDITKELEEMERHERDEKIRFMYNLSGILAHNLNNINMPVLVLAELLKEELKNTKYEEKLDMIINSVNKATTLINSLLKMSKNVHLLKKPIKGYELVEKILEKCKDIIPSYIELSLNISDGETILSIDDELIIYAVYQAIKNSVEAMPEGGNLYLRTYLKKMESKDYVREYFVIEIEDEGVGISDDIKNRIFEPFFTTKMAQSALGLGLSELLGIIEKHEGFVTVDSELNRGTIIKINIPVSGE